MTMASCVFAMGNDPSEQLFGLVGPDSISPATDRPSTGREEGCHGFERRVKVGTPTDMTPHAGPRYRRFRHINGRHRGRRSSMNEVRSKDGTTIAFDRAGTGP